jgi:catechol 2,3-dioxygenase-like lactoylglutathione lyase family enzyme
VKTALVFLVGLLLGCAIATGSAQSPRLAGDNFLNHVGIAYDDFDGARAFYTQKMGFPEAFVRRDDKGQITLSFVQISKQTFIEIQRATGTTRQGVTHYGLFLPDIKRTVADLRSRGVEVTDPRSPRPPEDSLSASATDPAGVRIEMFQFGPNSAQGKAVDSWK